MSKNQTMDKWTLSMAIPQPKTEEDRYMARLFKIITQHIGSDNAITSGELARIIDIPDTNGNPKVRSLITKTMNRYRIPIGAHSEGYFMISTKEELDAYQQNLFSRVKGINKRNYAVEIYFDLFSTQQKEADQ